MDRIALKEFLDEKADLYEQPEFVQDDPVQLPREFNRLQDCEIAGLLTATIAWGNRKSILKSAHRMMALMDHAPFDFITNHTKNDLEGLNTFVHRTFNGFDLKIFVQCLQQLYTQYESLEDVFLDQLGPGNMQSAISGFKGAFFKPFPGVRTQKHLGDPSRGSAAKRTNMFLRWMVRPAERGVDLGLWKRISPAQLSCPLDVHSGRVARKLGLLDRKQNDAKAVEELDQALRSHDPIDPVRYDYALFGLGAIEGF